MEEHTDGVRGEVITMSINVTVDNTTYEDISSITVGGKTVTLEQISEETDIFAEATGILSIGYIFHMCENALASGTLNLESPLSGSTVIVDTGLGSEMNFFVIWDDDETAFAGNTGRSDEGIYFFITDGTNGEYCQQQSSGLLNGFGPSNGNRFGVSDGKISFAPRVANNNQYTGIIAGRNYKWFAW